MRVLLSVMRLCGDSSHQSGACGDILGFSFLVRVLLLVAQLCGDSKDVYDVCGNNLGFCVFGEDFADGGVIVW